MLTIDKETLDKMGAKYPDIVESVRYFENTILPVCSRCGSPETAQVRVGINGLTSDIAAATTKVRLIINGPKPGKYWCNECSKFFD